MKELVRYAKQFAKAPMPEPLFTETIDGVRYELLAIDAPFQAERVIAPAGVPVPQHCHENLDAIEIYESGELHISVAGKTLPVSTGKSRGFLGGRKAVLIPRGTVHGPGLTGPEGFSFISIQQHDGAPVEVAGCPHRRFVAHE